MTELLGVNRQYNGTRIAVKRLYHDIGIESDIHHKEEAALVNIPVGDLGEALVIILIFRKNRNALMIQVTNF